MSNLPEVERMTPSLLAGMIETWLNREGHEAAGITFANLYGDPPEVQPRCGIVVRFQDGNELLVNVTESPR